MTRPMKDCHRLFLQSFMARGILLAKDVRKIHRTSCERFGDAEPYNDLVDFVSTINTNIKPVHLEIRKVVNEETLSHYYCLVNTRESDIVKLASDFTVNELEFFKKMIEYIVESEEGTLSGIDAINLSEKLEKKITKKEAEEVLSKFVGDLWLNKNSGGRYSLSPRSILELEQYLLEQYPDSTVKCNLCKKIAIQGRSCPSCDIKFHTYCADRFFEKKPNNLCPTAGCGTPWPHEVSTRANRENDPVSPPKESAASASGSRKRRATKT